MVILIGAFASVSASAEMRDIATINKWCGQFDGQERCTPESTSHFFKIDWPGKALEFTPLGVVEGTRVTFGGTAYVNEPPTEYEGRVIARHTEPTTLRASVDGYKLTFERTRASQFDNFFLKETQFFVFEFGQDGECKSFKIVTKVLETTASGDTGGPIGVSCSGRVDIP
jgi:hypothetical protein